MVCRRYGDTDALRLENLDAPAPGPGELLVRVRAAAVNPIDWHFLRGKPILVRLQYGFLRPKAAILGHDFAGTVDRVGTGVTRFQPGDHVFGGLGLGLGAFAEYARVPADGFVARKPANLGFEAAASVPGAGVTALLALRERGGIQPRDRVLVNGASGGVGTFAVQIARAMGAEVTGVCSTRNVEMVKRLGADVVVDYTRQDLSRLGPDYDLLLDNVGNRTAREMVRLVRPGGRVVVVGFTSLGRMLRLSLGGPRLAKRRDVDWVKPTSQEPGPDHAETLRSLLEEGSVLPEIEASYPLRELPAALQHIETRHARAKIVINMEDT